MTLLRSLVDPGDSFAGILLDAATTGVPPPEVKLRVGVALFRGQAVPGDGFGIILRDALARGVKLPEGELRLGIASLGEGAQVGEGLCCWAVFILSLCLNTGQTAHREGEDCDPGGREYSVATHAFPWA